MLCFDEVIEQVSDAGFSGTYVRHDSYHNAHLELVSGDRTREAHIQPDGTFTASGWDRESDYHEIYGELEEDLPQMVVFLNDGVA